MPAGAAGRGGGERAGRESTPAFDQLRGPGGRPGAAGASPGRLRHRGSSAGEAVRLVTLTGPGGVGKTRLAWQAAERSTATPRRGVAGGPGARWPTPALVPAGRGRRAGRARGARGGRSPAPWLTRLRDAAPAAGAGQLRAPGRSRAAAGRGAAARLPRAAGAGHQPGAAGRAPARHLAGCRRWPPAARRPEPAAGGVSARSEAVRLFVAAGAARPARLRPHRRERRGRGARSAARLDGLPLAIELAAARVRVLPPRRCWPAPGRPLRPADRRRPATRPAAPADAAGRRSTGATTCSPRRSRPCSARLAVFAGGWTLEAAEAVGAGARAVLTRADALGRLLARLVGPVALVAAGARRRGRAAVRYRLLETLREYALERLAATRRGGRRCGERHAAYYLALAEAAEPELRGRAPGGLARPPGGGARQPARGAALVGIPRARREQGLRLARGAVAATGTCAGACARGGRGCERSCARPPRRRPGRRPRRGAVGAAIAGRTSSATIATAAPCWRRAWRSRGGLGDERRAGPGASRWPRGLAAWRQGDPAARAIAEESVAWPAQAGDRPTLAEALARLGLRSQAQRPRRGARRASRRAWRSSGRLVTGLGCSAALSALARLAAHGGGPRDGARRLLRRGPGHPARDWPTGTASPAPCTFCGGWPPGGRHPRRRRPAPGGPGALPRRWATATASPVPGRPGAAAAAGVRSTRRASWAPPRPLSRRSATPDAPRGCAHPSASWPEVRPALGAAGPPARLGGRRGSDAGAGRRRGRLVAPGDVPAARAGTAAARRAHSPGSGRWRRWWRAGLHNRQIATALTIAERTAENHVEHILGKLGFRSRAQIAAWVVRQDPARRSPAAPRACRSAALATGASSG